RRLDNKPNTDFIVEYKEALPTREELFGIVKVLVDRWNSMKQRGNTFTRNQLFEQEAPKREEIQPLDMISMFWIDETKPKKYYGHGMPLTVEGVDYEFEVYTPSGEIDLEFRQKYVGEKLIVRYDPEYLNEMIELYELTSTGEKRFVAHATPKRRHEVVPALMKEGARAMMDRDMQVREMEYQRDLEAYEKLVAETGIGRNSMVESQELMLKMQGKMPKELQMVTDTDTLKTRLNKY